MSEGLTETKINMNNVTQGEIVNHEGTTCLLPKPETANGIVYPFAFDAVQPNEKSWSYRLCASRDPSSLTNETLTQLLGTSRQPLRADWEEQVGHAVGWITIYAPPPAGSKGSPQGRRARFEQGPEIELAPPQITPEPPKVRVPSLPEPHVLPDVPPPGRKIEIEGPDLF